MENIKSNEDITDITEVLEKTQNIWWFDRTDVSGYKWKLVSDNQNEPSQVHFYKEDMNDIWSVNLSTIFDRCLKEYQHHLDEIEEEEKRRVKREIQQKKDKLLDDKLNEVIDEYELFLKEKVKDELHKRNTNPEEDDDFDEFELKFTLTNLRKMLGYFSKNDYERNGIHYGDGNSRMNNIFIQKEWYLENYEKLTQIVFSIDPEREPSSQKYSKNQFGTSFMCLSDFGVRTKFYEKLYFLLRKMKKSKISYWYSNQS